jgi:hypothetical protein
MRYYEHLNVWNQPWISAQLAYERRQAAYLDKHLPELGLNYFAPTPPPTPPRSTRPKEWEKLLFRRFVEKQHNPHYMEPVVVPLKELQAKKAEIDRIKKLREDRDRRQKISHHHEDDKPGEHKRFNPRHHTR